MEVSRDEREGEKKVRAIKVNKVGVGVRAGGLRAKDVRLGHLKDKQKENK